MSSSELERLRAENAELRSRIDSAEAVIDEVRAASLARAAEVRALVEGIPAATSRKVVLRSVLRDARRHPDKAGVATRIVNKLARGPRKAWRMLLRRP